MKLTGYYMNAICKFSDRPFKLYDFERTKFGVVVQSADIVDMRNLLNLADMDGVI